MKIRNTTLAVLVLMLTGCGGGSSTDPVFGDNTNVSGTPWCELPYYRTIIGTYRGSVGFQALTSDNTEFANCQWDTTLSISGTSLLGMCILNMQLNASPTQLVIPASDDPLVYQCIGDDNRNYSIRDPNDTVNAQLLSDVGFPVFLGPSGHEFDPNPGPYFGDASVDAAHIYLFAGGEPIFDQLQISDLGYMDLVRTGSDGGSYNVVTRLNKVP